MSLLLANPNDAVQTTSLALAVSVSATQTTLLVYLQAQMMLR